jgi:aspartate/methionine/tyrosine aminotransferase
MWIDPGDTLILPDKNWGNYSLIFAVRRGANMVQYPLFDGGGHFNVEALKRCALAEAERADKLVFMLNFPNNPTGYMITPSEAEQITKIILDLASAGTKIVSISDDAYFGLFYDDDISKESIFSLMTGQDARVAAIKVDGATKENYVWGLRVGFITYGLSLERDSDAVHDALEKKTAGAVRGSISNVSHLSQTIVLKSIESDTYRAEKDEKYRIMKERALEVKRVLADTKYEKAWDVYPFNAGYFMCLRLKTVEAEPLRVHLLEKYGVGLISLGKRDIRIAFSCVDKQDIRKLFDTVYDGVEDLGA